jgi:hypothetical protein
VVEGGEHAQADRVCPSRQRGPRSRPI